MIQWKVLLDVLLILMWWGLVVYGALRICYDLIITYRNKRNKEGNVNK